MGRKRTQALQRIVAVALLIAPLTLTKSAGAQEGPIDLLSQYDIRIDGESTDSFNGDQLGASVDGGADVNGDGTPDVIVGAPFADEGTDETSNEGSAFVVFGDPSAGVIDTANMGSAGFRIDGADDGDRAGTSVAMAGDVNDDEFADVIVGAPEAFGSAGFAYVVFGKSSTTTVDLASLGSGGFRIDGQTSFDSLGQAVAGARDVNDDGLNDVVVGAWNAGNNTRNASGSTYVIFGKTSTTTVSTNALGAAGFRIDGALASDRSGFSVAGGRDINEDGYADVVVGAHTAGNNARSQSGSAYVVFGKETTDTIDLASLGTEGFRIDGAAANDTAGYSVGGARDVNDDGVNDVIVGAVDADNNARPDSGSAYVVFGKSTTSTVDLADLGTKGFAINGQPADDDAHFYQGAGHSVNGARDVNGDEFDDLIIGAPDASNNSRIGSGSAYVVFGKDDTSSVDLDALSSADGYRIDGAAAGNIFGGDGAGYSVGPSGDVNDDGLDDVVLGAWTAHNNDRTESGSAYIDLVADWLPGECANPRSGTDGDDTLIGGAAGDDITGGDGADDLSGEEGEDCVSGENGADPSLKGGENADTVTGGDGGDPSIKGGDGNDTLEGGEGEDTLEGGNGTDDAGGGKNKDTLEGGDNGDTLDGGDGEDTVKGEEGGDTLKGGENADTVKGGDGEDTVKGGAGGDTLEGGDKGDTLNGGDGQDTIEAGGGNDDIEADDGEKDTIKCGDGNDTVDADNKDVLIGC